MTSLLTDARTAEPAHLLVPPQVSSAGQEAIDLAASAGLFLDPWQQRVLLGALGERDDGKWSAFSVAVIVPRQNGKGSILEALELACLFLFGDALIMHSAHLFKTASDAFRRITQLIEGTPDLAKLVKQIYRGHGNESIELLSGQRLNFVARQGGAGRGFPGDKIILDEAYDLDDRAISNLVPTLATRSSAQIWYTSSAPLDEPRSDVLRRVCQRGRKGESKNLFYVEYCADSESAHDDREAIAKANPGYPFRINDEAIENEREEFANATDWARERLGIWYDHEGSAWVIPSEKWTACLNPKSGISGEMSFALDVAPDRSFSAIAVAGVGPRTHLEVIDHKARTDWLVGRCKELTEKWSTPVVIAENSPAWSLKADLETAGVELLTVSTAELAQACGRFYDAVIEERIHHLGQPELTRALAGAEKRFSGDAWLWSRKTSTTDISPLVAVTLALWAHSQEQETSVYETRGLVKA